jgi:hypothetical protein
MRLPTPLAMSAAMGDFDEQQFIRLTENVKRKENIRGMFVPRAGLAVTPTSSGKVIIPVGRARA